MKKAVFLVAIILFSCNSDNKIVLSSSGNLNEISVVISNDLWEAEAGKALKKALTEPIYGLPQQEPIFKLRQIPPEVFSGFVTKSRAIIKVQKSNQEQTAVTRNKYASPQTIVIISGPNSSSISEQIKTNTRAIINTLKKGELAEKNRRIRKSINKSTILDSLFKIKLYYPSVYRVAAAENGFVWLRKDTKSGSVNLSVYEAPLKAKTTPLNIIAIRDSVSQLKIPGPVEGTYMSTDPQYKSVSKQTTLNKLKATETRGLWEVKKQFMGGPYINFSVIDSTNNRILFFDGFVYSPATEKSSYIFELEAIIKSLKILN
tara:strand:- start:155 stop:1105 length:951 start_codon:yes stop_codon:yes gene_type:complete